MRAIDERYKILLFVIISITAFMVKDLVYGSLLFLCVCLITFAMGQVKLTLKYALSYAAVLGLTQAALWLPGALPGIFLMLGLCIRMFMPLLLYARAFSATTTVSNLVAAMHKMHVPKPLALAFTVAVRFFPMAKEEMDCIRDAMRLRGISFSLVNCFTRPGVVFEGALIPVMMRAASISEELAASSVSRGIDNPGRRTSYRQLVITRRDTALVILFSLLLVGVVLLKALRTGGAS